MGWGAEVVTGSLPKVTGSMLGGSWLPQAGWDCPELSVQERTLQLTSPPVPSPLPGWGQTGPLGPMASQDTLPLPGCWLLVLGGVVGRATQ
jgi:hypothetical protein